MTMSYQVYIELNYNIDRSFSSIVKHKNIYL
jgi:hypothetical protein